MSKWICKRCGTICQDFMDTICEPWGRSVEELDTTLERIDKLLNERIEIENKGEMPPLECQCGEKRVW